MTALEQIVHRALVLLAFVVVDPAHLHVVIEEVVHQHALAQPVQVVDDTLERLAKNQDFVRLVQHRVRKTLGHLLHRDRVDEQVVVVAKLAVDRLVYLLRVLVDVPVLLLVDRGLFGEGHHEHPDELIGRQLETAHQPADGRPLALDLLDDALLLQLLERAAHRGQADVELAAVLLFREQKALLVQLPVLDPLEDFVVHILVGKIKVDHGITLPSLFLF